MLRAQPSALVPDQRERWWVAVVDGADAGSGLASSPLAIPGLFACWIAVGLGLAVMLSRRGHDLATMVAVGAGLGPLMIIVASSAARQRSSVANPAVFTAGVDHGGPLDVLVMVQGAPADVRSVVDSLDAARSELGTLTLARALAYERVDRSLDDEASLAAATVLAEAAALLPIPGAELALYPGTADLAARRFLDAGGRRLALFAIGEPPDIGAIGRTG